MRGGTGSFKFEESRLKKITDLEIKKMLLKIIPSNQFISRGELYRDANIDGYNRSQETLLRVADEMVNEKVLIGKLRGKSQLRWYTGGKK